MEWDFSKTPKSMDEVPQDFRGLYQETDDGIALRSDDDGVKAAVSAITGLNKSLKAARAEAKDLKGKRVDLSVLAEYGETPEEIAETVQEKLAEASKKGGKEEMQRQIEKIKADLGSEYASKIEAANKRSEALQGQLHNILVTGEARSALAEAGAIDADLALPFLSQRVKVTEEEGKFQVLVVDDAGDPRYSGVTGAPMSVKELVQEMKSEEKYGPLFKSDRPSGGGAPAQQHRQTPGQRDRSEMSATDKIKAGLQAGQARRER